MGLYLDQIIDGTTQLEWLEQHSKKFTESHVNCIPVLFFQKDGVNVAGIFFSEKEFLYLSKGLSSNACTKVFQIPISDLDSITAGATSLTILQIKKEEIINAKND